MDEPDRTIRWIPPQALVGMEDWRSSVVWTFVPDVVTWQLTAPDGEVRYLKVSHLDRELTLPPERDRMLWGASFLPVPRVLDYGSNDEHEWLLTAGLPGVNAVNDALTADPARLVPLVAQALRRFHALPIEQCPFDSRAEAGMALAAWRVAAGRVDVEADLDPVHRTPTAENALTRLAALKPLDEDLVVCHGDFCLPNVLFDDWRLSGYVDLGKLGVADRWWDLGAATWSVTRNLGPGWEELFLAAYGVERDAAKLAFYRLLYDLVP